MLISCRLPTYISVTSHQSSFIDGYAVSDTDDYMQESERIMTCLAHDSQPGIWFVDLFPTRKRTCVFLAVSEIRISVLSP